MPTNVRESIIKADVRTAQAVRHLQYNKEHRNYGMAVAGSIKSRLQLRVQRT